jgi:3-deoxy-manno-octulosonate cytidylyltransferase (CMP-KDO synthetase)
VSVRAVGVIPARWESSRFPGKMLTPIAGKPLVQWVIERAQQASELDHVIVATDHQPIVDLAQSLGAEAVMTRADHPSGTDRVAEAAEKFDPQVVVNIQGDEPVIDPDLIGEMVRCLIEDASWDMATAAVQITDAAQINEPSVVKVVCGEAGRALYFSRAAIPHFRDESPEEALRAGLYFRHLGLYGYRTSFLRRLVQAEPTPLELAEKLEQLRALHLGAAMKVVITDQTGPGVDLPEDVPKAEKALRDAGLV